MAAQAVCLARSCRLQVRFEERRDMPHRAGYVVLFLPDGRDVMQCARRCIDTLQPGNDPGGEINRGQTPTGRRDVSAEIKSVIASYTYRRGDWRVSRRQTRRREKIIHPRAVFDQRFHERDFTRF